MQCGVMPRGSISIELPQFLMVQAWNKIGMAQSDANRSSPYPNLILKQIILYALVLPWLQRVQTIRWDGQLWKMASISYSIRVFLGRFPVDSQSAWFKSEMNGYEFDRFHFRSGSELIRKFRNFGHLAWITKFTPPQNHQLYRSPEIGMQPYLDIGEFKFWPICHFWQKL